MTAEDWGALISAAQKANADLKANRPLAPSTAPSGVDVMATLTKALPYIKEAAAAVKAYPGVIRAVDDLLGALKAHGCAWAADLEAALNAVPGAIAMVQEWLPTVIVFLSATQPAPTWAPGPEPFHGR